LLAFLRELGIQFNHVLHPPVSTAQEAASIIKGLPGTPSKNLFLRDKAGHRHFLVSVPFHMHVNLKALASVLNTDRLSFGSPERLQKHLGVAPGSVTLLGIINDIDQKVEGFVDRNLWEADLIHCHPLVNQESIIISPQAVEHYYRALGRSLKVVNVPSSI
jgi:Ala-tRNA(Pro) deacylase